MPATGTQDANDSGVMTSTNAATLAKASTSTQGASFKPPGQPGAQPPPRWTKEEDALLIDMMVKRFLINQRGYRLAADFQDRVRRYEPALPQRDEDDIWDRIYLLQRDEPCYDTEPSKNAKSRELDGPKSLPCDEQPRPSDAGATVVFGESGSNERGGDARVEGEQSPGVSEQKEQASSGSVAKVQQPVGGSQPDEGSKEGQPTQQASAKEGEQSNHDASHQENETGEEESPATEEQAKQADASQTTEPSKKKSRKHKRKREKEPPTLITERIPQRVRLTGQQPDGTAVRYMPNGEVRIEYGPA